MAHFCTRSVDRYRRATNVRAYLTDSTYRLLPVDLCRFLLHSISFLGLILRNDFRGYLSLPEKQKKMVRVSSLKRNTSPQISGYSAELEIQRFG